MESVNSPGKLKGTDHRKALIGISTIFYVLVLFLSEVFFVSFSNEMYNWRVNLLSAYEKK